MPIPDAMLMLLHYSIAQTYVPIPDPPQSHNHIPYATGEFRSGNPNSPAGGVQDVRIPNPGDVRFPRGRVGGRTRRSRLVYTSRTDNPCLVSEGRRNNGYARIRRMNDGVD